MSKRVARSVFPNPWVEPFRGGTEPLCVIEWTIIDIVNAIRQKPQWQVKYKDDTIFNKWVKECEPQISDKTLRVIGGKDYVHKVFDHVRKTLHWYEEYPAKFCDFEPFSIEFSDKICSSMKLIPNETQKELQNLSNELQASFEEIDYHPKSNNQVIDLVHPSLYHVQYGITPVVKDGKVRIAAFDKHKISSVKPHVDGWGISKSFQWLPSVFERQTDGSYRIGSYINNLHPKNKPLYKVIESVWNSVIPGLNYTLSRYAAGLGPNLKYPRYVTLYTEEFDQLNEEMQEKAFEDGDWDAYEKFFESREDYIKPVDFEFEEPKHVDFDLKSYGDLKVIVKMANIELTPENKKYEGGSWHIEGCINEDIVATVLYYYDVENITESKLSFRTTYDDPPYEQGDDLYCNLLFDVQEDSSPVKNLGSVTAANNKVVIFPNGYQHHVDPFELSDPTKPGHRKILCFFLVDPSNDVVLTTKDVPPQQPQKEWQDLIEPQIRKQIEELEIEHWPFSLEEMKRVRELLMEQRSEHFEDYDEEFTSYSRTFSLCEH